MNDGLQKCTRMCRTAAVGWTSLVQLVSLLVRPVHAAIPYSPSHLLYSSQSNDSFAYLLRPNDSHQNASQFLSLNISGKVDPANPQYTLLLDELPFRADNQSTAFIPAIDQHGYIKVLAGGCHNPTEEQSSIWEFKPNRSTTIGNGTWERHNVELDQHDMGIDIQGPSYLAAGFAWASTNGTKSSLYTFGGMCPFNVSSKATWTYAANYSQSMMVLSPPDSSATSAYKLSTGGHRAPPIAEAGFTITPLQPTYASSPSSRTPQQQDFLMIGGHTQKAFLNMSELAIYSLPHDSWSFITVHTGADAGKTELAVRDEYLIEPRSGHTAVLSPDGGRIVVFGGWVGSTARPADPQLAILEMGEDFGGSGAWKWMIPSTQGTGLADGTGIYGHGATMLPGGVMMIAGGYSIPKFTKRSAAGFQANSQVYLYNVTSGSWVTSYVNPSLQEAPSASSSTTSSLSKKAGLGVGLGLGIPAAAGLAVFTWFHCRRRRVRRSRDRELRKLALSAQRAHFWGRDEPEMASSIRVPRSRNTTKSFSWNSGEIPNWERHGEAAAERTGLLVGVPNPPKNSQQSLGMRPYRYSGPYHEYRRSDATGDIHPIDERDEEEGPSRGYSTYARAAAPESISGAEFLTPQSTMDVRNYLGPSTLHMQDAPGQDLQNEGALSGQDERTSSNLSDSSTSAKSGATAHSSIRGSFSLPIKPSSPDKPPSTSTHGSALFRENRYSSDSYSTAHTTLSSRQAEGVHLLRNDPEPPMIIERSSARSPSPRPKMSGWIGSVRRVLSGTQKRVAGKRDSWTSSVASGIDRRRTVVGSRMTDESEAESRVPRRAVSASAELFRRKQGARDWGAGNRVSRDSGLQTIRSQDDTALDGLMDFDDADWDVEGAAEGRRVQVSFTVPKEKLRVVNATAGDLDNLSELSISRSNSGA
ncbi:uncharacterized protein ACLA_027620 [Aspergillus clavatus NRRL 1]|uniref:Galactose oxidase n=1 Tax=Aspergillus clavatus (strain ATCC 1007 / CBS 513.65 / DSM 816 / NCTC 3887 / NRRL 1 / QM 1276 / 107) TaxID=344612 RepID=A1CQW9_ASPCL|nr:uncharacterized protein ACLA_027620 [Aspergillus clavatus NRRL 1]EAW08040.1 conserved hypothetical protein [Aspergillus clavatus NRRL 1]